MNWVFWFLIILILALVWACLISIFRPVGKGINFLKDSLDIVINGDDEDNILDEKENKDE